MGNNDVLSAVALMERILPLLKENTRESIRKDTLSSIKRNVEMCIGKVIPYTKDNLILVPLVEISELISTLMQDDEFVESSDECKKLFIDKAKLALNNLYMFAGKFYETTEFNYSVGMSENIIRIIESCMDQGYYFGYDKQLKEEGLLQGD